MPPSPTSILGIDCAASLANAGAAAGRWVGGGVEVVGMLEASVAALGEWIGEEVGRGRRVLVALDAPLGWPREMGERLAGHAAGRLVDVDRNLFFRRETDRWVKAHVGQQPLSVGADWLAWVAHATLQNLEGLRHRSGQELPLAWESGFSGPTGCIEVYPAATLRARNLPNTGYKEEGREQRKRILKELSRELRIPPAAGERALARHHDLDALVCLLAALDFLRGEAPPPEDRELAEKEGWIWVRALLESPLP